MRGETAGKMGRKIKLTSFGENEKDSKNKIGATNKLAHIGRKERNQGGMDLKTLNWQCSLERESSKKKQTRTMKGRSGIPKKKLIRYLEGEEGIDKGRPLGGGAFGRKDTIHVSSMACGERETG